MEQQLAALMDLGLIPGASMAVSKSGELVYQNGFGIADPAGREVTPDTPFFLASVTSGVSMATISPTRVVTRA